MKNSKFEFHEDEIFHLNIGVPIVFGFILLFINYVIFDLKFLENSKLLFSFYTYATGLILIGLYMLSKKDSNNKRIVNISLYDFGIYNALMVMSFLVVNILGSKTIFENSTNFDSSFKVSLNSQSIPYKYYDIYYIDDYDYEKYYKKGYSLEVKISKSFLGYEILKERKFIKR